MLPGMIVLGVLPQHSPGDLELCPRITQPLHQLLPVVPHLVVLGLVQDDYQAVLQLCRGVGRLQVSYSSVVQWQV